MKDQKPTYKSNGPEVIVNVLTAIEQTVTDKWTDVNGIVGYGAAPNVVSEVVYELLMNAGYAHSEALLISDQAQRLVENFVTEVDGEMTYR